MRSDIHDYPVGATIHDVVEYYKARTFLGSISNIQKQAAVAQAKAEKATQKVKHLETVDELLKKGGT